MYSIGHYNHSKDKFLEMLRTKEIDFVADVRTIPGSNRSPHFNKDHMKEWLEEASITYLHFPKLGGRRKVSSEVGEVLNEGWENQSFHNYADYTLTESFKQGIEALKFYIKDHRVVLMCAEHHPSRCHRLIISNYLQANGYNVIHLLPDKEGTVKSVEHELGKWGATPLIEKDLTVVYPKIKS